MGLTHFSFRSLKLPVVILILFSAFLPTLFSPIASGFSVLGNTAHSSNQNTSGQVSASNAEVTLTSPNAQQDGYFGTVAVSGDIVVVGAHGENSSGVQDAGRAYALNATTGKLITTLLNPYPQAADDYGEAVAVSGDIAVVGAPLWGDPQGSNTGQAYVYSASSGKLLSVLSSPNAQIDGYFGWSVAVNGNVAIVGAYGEGVDGNAFAGHAYAFDAKTGSLISTFTSPNAQFGGSFGTSVAISGKIVVIGAPYETGKGEYEAGHAYTFNTHSGKLIKTLTSPHAKEYGAFGYSVGISGSLMIISASGIAGEDKVYSFNSSTGALISTITDPNSPRGFGWSVAIGGNTAIVGAPFETINGSVQAGHAYTFNAITGKLESTFSSPDVQAYGYFGLSVSASVQIDVVGAVNMTADGYVGAGQAFLFS